MIKILKQTINIVTIFMRIFIEEYLEAQLMATESKKSVLWKFSSLSLCIEKKHNMLNESCQQYIND